MKLLILLVACAAVISVPLDTQSDPLAELLQKVLEANPEENDIGTDGAVFEKKSVVNKEENKELASPTETPLSNGADIVAEIVDVIKSSLADSVDTIENSQANVTEDQTKTKAQVDEQVANEQTEEQTTIPSTEEQINDVDGLPRIDEVFAPQTQNQYEDIPVANINEDNNTDYDGDIFDRLPEEQHNWTPNDDSYSPDNFNLFQPISKDYEDHMTMLENPFLSPIDTLPLDPSLLDGSSIGVHGHMNPDYPFYDYMDETGVKSDVESNNSNVKEIVITPNETLVMEDTLPTEDITPTVVESNSDALINEDTVTKQILTYDEIPAVSTSEWNENQQVDPMNMMENISDNLPSVPIYTDEQSDMFQVKESQNFNSQMRDFDYDTMNMNNDPDYNTYNSYSSRRPNTYPYDQYYNMDDMYFNPYTFHPNNLDEILYRSLLQENEYGMNHDTTQDYYPDDASSMLNSNMNVGATTDQNEVNYEEPVSERMEMPIGKAIDNTYPQMESLFVEDDSLSNDRNNNVEQETGSTDSFLGSDFTPMAEILPLTRENSAVEIPSNSNSAYSISNNYNQNKQDMSLLLYNSLLRNLGTNSFSNNMMMNPYLINPLRRNYVPLVVFIDSANKNEIGNNMNDISTAIQGSAAEEQDNQIENSFINEDGTLLTDIEHNVNIPYSPGYHPAFYSGYNNLNQYYSGYNPAPQSIDMTTYPYASNVFNSYPSKNDYYGGHYPKHQYRNRHYNPYSDYLLNMQAQRNYYRRDPIGYLQNYYY